MHFKFTERCETCSSLRIFVILSGRVATAVIQLFSRQTFLLLSFDHIRFSAVPLILFNKTSSLEKRKQLELCWYPSNRTHRYSWKTKGEIRNVKKHKKSPLVEVQKYQQSNYSFTTHRPATLQVHAPFSAEVSTAFLPLRASVRNYKAQ